MQRAVKYFRFFLSEFHQGAVNHTLHFIGFTILGYGLAKENWWLVLFSPVIMESGHIYNYLRGVHSHHAIKILPVQFGIGAAFVALVYVVVKFLGL